MQHRVVPDGVLRRLDVRHVDDDDMRHGGGIVRRVRLDEIGQLHVGRMQMWPGPRVRRRATVLWRRVRLRRDVVPERLLRGSGL